MNKIVYYELVRRELTIHKNQLVSAAVRSCQLCGETISGMGGPGGSQELCVSCGEEIMDGKIKYNRKEQ